MVERSDIGAPSAGRHDHVPEVWGKIPPRNKNFTGRTEQIAQLRRGLAGDVTAVVSTGPQALQGMGGVGKTLLAVEYAYRYQHEYDLVWWIPSDDESLVRSSLAALAPRLGLPPLVASGIDDSADAVLDTLRRGVPFRRWLLIFDNADEPEILAKMIPRGPGHVIVTSRNHQWIDVADTVAIDVFTRDESIDFLTKRTRLDRPAEDADLLAEALGDLPLALEQAGALQAETGISTAEYLRLLNERTEQVLAEGSTGEYPLSMSAAWALSADMLSERMPEALQLLQLCAFFGPEPIPRDVFSQVPGELRPEIRELLSNPIPLSRVISGLGKYALARIDPKTRTIQVHRLIQALVRQDMDPAEQRVVRHEVHELLVAATPPEPDDLGSWDRYTELLPHFLPSGSSDCEKHHVRKFCRNMARFLYVSGQYPSSRTASELLVNRWTEQQDASDVDALKARRALGIIMRAMGDFSDAYTYNQETWALLNSLAAPPIEDLLLLLNSIGADLRARGEFPRALDHDLNNVRRHTDEFGPEDPNTLASRHNLALDHALMSDYGQALKLHNETYRLQQRDPVGNSAHSRLLSLSGLARAVRLTGSYDEACDLGEDATGQGIRELGVDHPVTLAAAKDLAIALRRAGRFEDALERAEEVHGRYLRRAGQNDPGTMAAAMSLSNVLRATGNLGRATELAAETMARYPRFYGESHPYNHGCTSNYALLLRLSGARDQARALNERSLKGLEAFLGRDHHYSLTVAANLATDLFEMGDLEDSAALTQGTMRRAGALLGEQHPFFLSCMGNLSVTLSALNRHDEADELFEDVMRRYEDVTGLHHPDAVVAAQRQHLDADFDPPPF